MFLIYFTVSIVVTVVTGEIILYAENFGGDTFEASDGVVYQSNKQYGTGDFPGNLSDVPAHDQPLYQKASVYQNRLEIPLPIAGNGLYVLTLKFPSDANKITMNVMLNRLHTVLENFDAVVNATNNKIFTFEVYNHALIWNEHHSEIKYFSVPIAFVGSYGNAVAISAIKLTYTPSPRTETLLQDIRDDFRTLFSLLARKENVFEEL
jgi:Malectin domain